METDQNFSAAKQYPQEQKRSSRSVLSSLEYQNNQKFPSRCSNFDNVLSQPKQRLNYFPEMSVEKSDEPIDLTTINNRNDSGNFKLKEPIELGSLSAYPTCNPIKQYNYFPQRLKEQKLIYTEDEQILMVNIHNDHISSVTFSPEKQFEVLKAAKSLFSKRTRTLYHWMYPNISRQEIKQAVTSSWESLNRVEKEFYISQVLGRFGFSHSNLMINPQLDSIKVQPSLPIPRENELNRKVYENSGSKKSTKHFSRYNRQFAQNSEEQEFHRKRINCYRNRQPSEKRRKTDHTADFKDDPELSFELEKFAINFNLSKV